MLSTHRLPCSDSRLVRFGARIVVRDLESNFPRILAAACQSLPYVVLASSSNNDALEIDPGLSDEIRFLVVSEDGDLELVVVGRIMHCKSQLLVPAETKVSERSLAQRASDRLGKLTIWESVRL